ncbi:MAG: hypothetical protein IT579_00820 [Verrucomicrobia subdivision 3 bacterium]|nr:hypothetical protein [Limisphaerales bacterium]
MNERLVEDWLAKANERLYQTPFAQSLIAEGMEVLRVAHSPHEHGKDIIAVDKNGRVHAYQLKDGDLDLKDFEKGLGQIIALVETQVEHPAISGQPRHQPWLVVSGQISVPAEDRIRVHNIRWGKRPYTPLKVITGRQLLVRFATMSANFWPQVPEDSNRLFNLYLANGKNTLDRDNFVKLIAEVTSVEAKTKRVEVERRLSAANLFASYALSPFHNSKNHWELVQGWTIAAAQIAWAADQANLPLQAWQPTFRLATNAALRALADLAWEALQPDALRPGTFCELDELTRSRCTVCAGAIAAQILVSRQHGNPWEHESNAKECIEKLFTGGRLFLWGESAVPPFVALVWALDQLRGDQFADRILFSALSGLVHQNSNHSLPKSPSPYDSADDANSKWLKRLFEKETALDLQATASYSLEALVTLVARRLWRNTLAALWSPITKIDMVRLTPDHPRDILLWNWGNLRGANQSRKFGAPQSWAELLDESRRDESDSLPDVIRTNFDFGLLFMLCFPHRLSRSLVKHFEERMRFL